MEKKVFKKSVSLFSLAILGSTMIPIGAFAEETKSEIKPSYSIELVENSDKSATQVTSGDISNVHSDEVANQSDSQYEKSDKKLESISDSGNNENKNEPQSNNFDSSDNIQKDVSTKDEAITSQTVENVDVDSDNKVVDSTNNIQKDVPVKQKQLLLK